jgi:hypothetical protein
LNAIASLDVASVAKLSTDQAVALTTAQVIELTTAQFEAMTTAQLKALTSTQVAVIETADVVAMGISTIASLKEISSLSTASVAALTDAQTGTLATAQIAALSSAQFVALTPSQVGSLTAAQVAVISSAGAAALSADIASLVNISRLQTASITGLSTDQLRLLSNDQIDCLTTAQWDALGASTSSMTSLQTAAYAASNHQGQTPIALDLDSNGVHTLSAIAGAVYDVNADGRSESVGWLSTADAWLALDRNGNGLIDDGSELFGSGTTMPDGSKAFDGFAALRVLDTNRDGVIDANDAAFASLSIWVDANSNAKTDAGELRTLNQAGIASLSLVARPTAVIEQGNLIGLMGSYTTTDGSTHEMADVWLSASALGARVVDLSALDHGAANAGTLSRINFTGNGAGDTLKVSLSDVLSFGDTSVVAGLDTAGHGPASQMVVSGEAQDTVQLADAGNWTMSGTTIIGDASYRVLTQGMAQLLIEDKVKIVAV